MMLWQFTVTFLVEWPKHAYYQFSREQREKAGMENLSGSVLSLEASRLYIIMHVHTVTRLSGFFIAIYSSAFL